MTIAARMAGIEPFHVMELMAKAQALEAQGRAIVHMEVGEPDFPTPQPIVEAAQRFLAGGHGGLQGLQVQLVVEVLELDVDVRVFRFVGGDDGLIASSPEGECRLACQCSP